MEAELRKLLYTKLAEFGTSESLTILWPNTVLPTTKPKIYLSTMVMPTAPEVLTTCGTGVIYTWLWQISLYVKDGLGELVPLRHVDSLIDFLPILTKFVGAENTYQLIAPGNVIPPVVTDGWFFIPVQFRVHLIT